MHTSFHALNHKHTVSLHFHFLLCSLLHGVQQNFGQLYAMISKVKLEAVTNDQMSSSPLQVNPRGFPLPLIIPPISEHILILLNYP
jgi:hypothetical protein